MKPPEVLSFREFRAGLAAAIRHVKESDDGAVFVGSHRKPDAVLISAARYREVEMAEQRAAVAEALASVRAEGLEPSADGLARLNAVAEGRLTVDEALEQALKRYRR